MKLIHLMFISLLLSFVHFLFRGICLFLNKTLDEKTSKIISATVITIQIVVQTIALIFYFYWGAQPQEVHLPLWFNLEHYRFESSLILNTASLVHAQLASMLMGLALKYSFQYLHREDGHNRFFFLLSVLSFGLSLVSYSGSFDNLFVGWELIGISSALLIAFFSTNSRSVQNSFRTMVFYRISDSAMLMASALLHLVYHTTIFSEFHSHDQSNITLWIGLLLLVASLAKSAQFPFMTWLPRAMEGPTSSSAIYYGALSVHLGPFLLLRTANIWEPMMAVRLFMAANGLLTFVMATLCGRTRSDIKSQLGYYTIAQIGIMYVELALGAYELVLVHMTLHAIYRALSFLRSLSWIQDVQENKSLYQLAKIRSHKKYSNPLADRVYHMAQQGFYIDHLFERIFVLPLQSVFLWIQKMNQFIGTGAALIIYPLIAIFILAYSGFSVESLEAFSMLCLLVSFVHASISLSSLDAKESLHQLFISFLGLILLFCFEYKTHFEMIFTVVVLSLMMIFSLSYLFRQLEKMHPTLRLNQFYGFAKKSPQHSKLFFMCGFLLAGMPGGVSFVVEDLVFHTLLETSKAVTFGFIILTALNTVSFYRIYNALFMGSSKFKEPLSTKPWTLYLIATFVILYIVLGMLPNLYIH